MNNVTNKPSDSTSNIPDERHKGEFVNGVYVGNLNGTVSGLNCPKGTKLVDPTLKPAIFYLPDDVEEGEDFKLIDPENPISKDVTPMYIVSNYGRVYNIATENYLKPRNQYGYLNYTLSASGEKPNKKIMAHRLVLSTFEPKEGMEDLQVNHKNMVKTDNYVNKPMPDGSLETNLEWCTAQENIQHKNLNTYPITFEEATQIREYKKQGYSIRSIRANFFPNVKYNTIKYVCENKFHHDDSYDPSKNPPPTKRMAKNDKFSDEVIENIRELSANGIRNTEIQDKYYPNIPLGTISDIIRKHIHSND